MKLPQQVQQQVSQFLSQPRGSLLLHGQGPAKEELASDIVRRLLCQGCQGASCHSCRLAQSGNHPDIILLAPDNKSKISIEAVQALHHTANLNNYQPSGTRSIIIQQADQLSLPASHALLKILEEPPIGTVAILTASTPGALLDTIISRCRQIFVPGQSEPAPKELTDKLNELMQANLFERLRLAANLAAEAEVQAVSQWARQAARKGASAQTLQAAWLLHQRLAANVAARTAFEAFALELP